MDIKKSYRALTLLPFGFSVGLPCRLASFELHSGRFLNPISGLRAMDGR